MNVFAHSRLRTDTIKSVNLFHTEFTTFRFFPLFHHIRCCCCCSYSCFKLDENKINRSSNVHAIAASSGQFVEWSHDVSLWMVDFYDRFFFFGMFIDGLFIFFGFLAFCSNKFWKFIKILFDDFLEPLLWQKSIQLAFLM